MSAKINRKTVVRRGRVFDVTVENVTLENGTTVDLEVIRHPGAAAIVAMPDPATVVLLYQYRHALDGYVVEIPAGTVDGRESDEACARRELTEETGWVGNRWESLGEIVPVPGYSDERIHLFLATDLESTRQHLDADELIEVKTLPFAKALEMVWDGSIKDAKTIAGLLLAAHRLEAGRAFHRNTPNALPEPPFLP